MCNRAASKLCVPKVRAHNPQLLCGELPSCQEQRGHQAQRRDSRPACAPEGETALRPRALGQGWRAPNPALDVPWAVCSCPQGSAPGGQGQSVWRVFCAPNLGGRGGGLE